MSKVIASLSEQGWITESKKILSNILSNYILTDSAQSVSFQGRLINLPETYYLYINDPEGMATKVRADLELLLGRYFESVDVECSPKQLTDKKYAIIFSCAAVDSTGQRVQVTKIAEMSTELRNVIEVSNYGEALSVVKNFQ